MVVAAGWNLSVATTGKRQATITAGLSANWPHLTVAARLFIAPNIRSRAVTAVLDRADIVVGFRTGDEEEQNREGRGVRVSMHGECLRLLSVQLARKGFILSLADRKVRLLVPARAAK